MGCALFAGGSWKGDILVADVEEFQENDASEVYVKRINTKEVIVPKEEEFLNIPKRKRVLLRWQEQVLKRRGTPP